MNVKIRMFLHLEFIIYKNNILVTLKRFIILYFRLGVHITI